MRTILLFAIVAGWALALAGGADARSDSKTRLVQMLGTSKIVGDVAVIDDREGTDIDFKALGVEGHTGDFICFEMPLLDMASKK